MKKDQGNVALDDPVMREKAKRATIFEDTVYVPVLDGFNENYDPAMKAWDDSNFASMSAIRAKILDSNGRLNLENADLSATEKAA